MSMHLQCSIQDADVPSLKTSSSAIPEKPRCRVCQFWPKVEDDMGIFNHCDVIILQNYPIRWSKAK